MLKSDTEHFQIMNLQKPLTCIEAVTELTSDLHFMNFQKLHNNKWEQDTFLGMILVFYHTAA